MRSHNSITLIGNLANTPEIHETQNGKKMCQFAVAINRNWHDNSGETPREVDFHKVIAWGKLAEICQNYLKKGLRVFIQGQILNRVYEANNEKKYTTEIHAEEIEILTSKAAQAVKESKKEEAIAK